MFRAPDVIEALERLKQWQQERVSQAIAMPQNKREAFLKEHRLDKFNLSLTPQRWWEQKHQHQLLIDKYEELPKKNFKFV